MNIFARYAARSMKKNHTRTRITWIGMILSMALFTAVIEGAFSCVQWLKNSVREQDGSFEAVYHAQDPDSAKMVADDKEVREALMMQINGWAKIPSANDYKPYLLIESGDLNSSLLKVKLTSGHLPENENEIILPENMKSYMADPYDIGESLTVDVGTRTDNGKVMSDLDILDYGKEEIVDASAKTYTVTGYYERLSTEAESLSCPGFTAFTKGGDAIGVNVYVTLKNIRHLKSFMQRVPDESMLRLHSDLTRFDEPALGGVSDGLLAVIRGLAAILIGLVMVGSVSLIYNAFTISVSERQKEYGLLKSIGASRAQIRSTVLFEALMTGAAGIIPGIAVGLLGTGITLHLMSGTLTALRSGSTAALHLIISWKGLLLASAICMATVLTAAWIPAHRAIRATPMDAIRQKDDIRIRKKSLRTPKYIKKLFGLEGVLTSRNFQRSRKRFRTTILSLSISVVLFVSASSFSLYLHKTMQLEYSTNPYDIMVQMVSNSPVIDASSVNEVYDSMKSCGDVTSGMYYSAASPYQLLIDPSLLTAEALQQTDSKGSLIPLHSSQFIFVDDDSFRQMLRDNGLTETEYFHTDQPLGLFYNTELAVNEDGKTKEIQVVRSSRDFTVYNRAIRQMEGMIYGGSDTINGEEYILYYDDDYIQSMQEEGKSLDPVRAKKIPADQVQILIPFRIGAVISSSEIYESIGYRTSGIIYPMSMLDAVAQMNQADSQYTSSNNVWMQFAAKDHASTAKIMTDAANEMSSSLTVTDMTASRQQEESFVFMISALSYAFITLIALIATANIFNTISTNLQLRRKEFAMLRSVGMTMKSFRKMLYEECLLYGFRSLIISIPVSVLVTYGIYLSVRNKLDFGFILPWKAILIAVIAIFASVGAAMLYGGRKLAKENLVEALRNENA